MVDEMKLLPGDPIAASSLELPQEQLLKKLAVERRAQEEVLPFEQEKFAVTRDHVAAQASIWGPSPNHGFPVELSNNGRKA